MAPTGILHYGITAMLSQLTYCATSFARLGFDFHMLLLPLFDMRCARVSGKLSRAVEFARASETSWAAVGAPRGGAGTAGGTLFEAPRMEARGAAAMFYNPTCIAGKDPRGTTHGLAIARFLQGNTKIKMSDIIVLIYSHKHSAPSLGSTQYHEHHAPFSPSISPAVIKHARPSLFTWATNLIGNHVYQEIHKLTAKNNNSHLSASTNGRCPEDSINLVFRVHADDLPSIRKKY